MTLMRAGLAFLLLNLALFGFLVFRVLQTDSPGAGRAEAAASGPLYSLVELDTLTPEDREIVRAVIAERLPELESARGRADQEFEALRATFQVQPFNPQAARDALRDLRLARADQFEAAVEVYIDAFDALPADAQRRVLEAHELSVRRRDGEEGS